MVRPPRLDAASASACAAGVRYARAAAGSAYRRRQRADPPRILLMTPESLALMLSYPEGGLIFRHIAEPGERAVLTGRPPLLVPVPAAVGKGNG